MDLKAALGRLKSQPKSSMHFFFCEQGKDGKPVLLIESAPIKQNVSEPVLKDAKKKVKAEGYLLMPEEGHLLVVPKGSAPSSLTTGVQIVARNLSCMPKSITVGKPGGQAPVPDKKVTELLFKQKNLLDKIKVAVKTGTPGAAASFKTAMLAVSEAGALLRGKDADTDKAEALLGKAEESLRKGEATTILEKRSGVGTKSTTGGSTTTGGVDDDEGEDDEDEDEDEESGTPKSKSTGEGYDPKTGQYVGRPTKPKSLRGQKDESGDPLTAHHIYPWNKLRSDMNEALKDPSGGKMKKILAFAKHTVDSSFWVELAKAPAQRSQEFVTEVNRAATVICWGPANIFMGPLNTKRGDDPGSKLDHIRSKSGLPTPSSAVGELVNKKGGLTKDNPLAELLAKNVQEAQTGDDGKVKPHRYDKQEWIDDEKGKRVRRGQVPIKQMGGKLDERDDTDWAPIKKKPVKEKKEKEPPKAKEEIERLQKEARLRKEEKEKAKVVPESQQDEDEGIGGMDMFNSEQ